MKALSIKQPFAYLLVDGTKTIEMRALESPASKTKYRGPMLICASKQTHIMWDAYYNKYAMNRGNYVDAHFRRVMDRIKSSCDNDIELLKQKVTKDLGCIVGIANLKEINLMESHEEKLACHSWEPGIVAMRFTEPMWLYQPIPLEGLTNGFHLGIFDVNIELEQLGSMTNHKLESKRKNI